jgi:HEAT repeat protein
MASFQFLRRARRACMILIVMIGLAVIGFSAFRTHLVYGYDQDIEKLNRFVQTTRPDTPAMKMFREGRDLIEAGNWQQAAEKFHSFIDGFPKDKDMDAALYWYGYALQKQGRKDEAVVPLERLIKRFPSSSWRREADAMLVVLNRADIVKAARDSNDCEIKVLALQSLFQADEERALNFVNEVLKSNSTDCPTLKAAAVSLLGSHGGTRAVPILLDLARSSTDLKLRLTAIRRLGEQNNDNVADDLGRIYDTDQAKEIKAQILRAFAEMHSAHAEAKLIQIARSDPDPAMRQLAIRYLGERNGGGSLDELLRLYDSERTPEIRSQILRALSERDDPKAQAKLLQVAKTGETPELRIEAIRRLSDHGRMSIDDLLQLYSTESNMAIKQGLLRAYGDIKDPRAQGKLLEVARSTDALELRMMAIRKLGDKDDEQTVTQLTAMYDGEPNAQVRGALIRSFGDSHQKVAIHKLMTIARNDPSVDLRKLAVRMLGESKDPEALKFLEDLLK